MRKGEQEHGIEEAGYTGWLPPPQFSFCRKRRPELSFNTIAKSVVTNILNAHIFVHVLCETCRMFYIVMLAIIKRGNGTLQIKGHV